MENQIPNYKENAQILVVDDSNFSRKIISRILTGAGFQVKAEAESASSTVEALKDHPEINLCLIDIIMPEISGLDLARSITKSYPHMQVIMMSSLSQDHIIIESIAAGAVDFIKKPFERDTLIESVTKISKEILNAPK